MPQMLLPLFPAEATPINELLAFCLKGDIVYYFNGQMPIFSHHVSDIKSFRLISSQLAVNRVATQSEIVRAFGVSTISVKRYVKCYRENGPEGFFKPRKSRSGKVLTPEVQLEVQALLSKGHQVDFISAKLDLKKDTVNKAIRDGRLHRTEDAEKKTVPI